MAERFAGRLWKAPALHFVLVGALLFLAFGRDAPRAGVEGGESPVLEISSAQLALAREDFAIQRGRQPSVEEEKQILQTLVDREILVRHAMEQGLGEQETVQRRLAQIAAFVADEGEAQQPTAALAQQALELGLHRDDVVVRRILEDSARRLIRGAVLAREPSEEALETYLHQHPQLFQQPPLLRLSLQGNQGEASSLPPLLPRDLERRFGRAFVAQLADAPVGQWLGPFPSREGELRVRVEEREERQVRELEEVRSDVRARVRQELADRWLEARLEQLREHYQIVVQQEKDPEEDPGSLQT